MTAIFTTVVRTVKINRPAKAVSTGRMAFSYPETIGPQLIVTE
jgi:hypothetical protein